VEDIDSWSSTLVYRKMKPENYELEKNAENPD